MTDTIIVGDDDDDALPCRFSWAFSSSLLTDSYEENNANDPKKAKIKVVIKRTDARRLGGGNCDEAVVVVALVQWEMSHANKSEIIKRRCCPAARRRCC